MDDVKILDVAVKDVTQKCVKLSLEHPNDEKRVLEVLKLIIDAQLKLTREDLEEAFKRHGWWFNSPREIADLYIVFRDHLPLYQRPPVHLTRADLERWKRAAEG